MKKTLREIPRAQLASVRGGTSGRADSDITLKGSSIGLNSSDIYIKFGDITGEPPP